jgi:modulator of FtsH protease
VCVTAKAVSIAKEVDAVGHARSVRVRAGLVSTERPLTLERPAIRHIPEMDAAYDPAAWHDFGVGLVSATAALLGLVFVVVSLHLKAVVNDSVLRRRAEITLGLFATALVASAVLLIPGQSRQALGIELMPIALVYIGFSTLTTITAIRSQRGVSRDRLARFFFGEMSAGLIVVGGLGLVIHALGGAYLVAAGIILGVLCSMLAIWSLFVGLGLELEG